MSYWKPIESAPRDGTLLLLWSKTHEKCFIGYWVDSEEFRYGKRVRHSTFWYCFEGGQDDSLTHWMPLPGEPLT